jgi:hypothetical protein
MATLSDPGFKMDMTISFMKHMEVLCRFLHKSGYNLLRYAVQIFTSEEYARTLILHPTLWERSLRVQELFYAQADYQERNLN